MPMHKPHRPAASIDARSTVELQEQCFTCTGTRGTSKFANLRFQLVFV
jgi:hypothetical protein